MQIQQLLPPLLLLELGPDWLKSESAHNRWPKSQRWQLRSGSWHSSLTQKVAYSLCAEKLQFSWTCLCYSGVGFKALMYLYFIFCSVLLVKMYVVFRMVSIMHPWFDNICGCTDRFKNVKAADCWNGKGKRNLSTVWSSLPWNNLGL